MSMQHLLREHLRTTVGVVLGGAFSAYGVVSDAMGLYQLGLPGWVWQHVGVALVIASLLLLLARVSAPKPAPKTEDEESDPNWKQKLERIDGRLFKNCEVPLDDRWYSNCTFDSVTFVYNGGPFALNKNDIGPHSVHSNNPALQRFANLLAALGHVRAPYLTPEGIIDQAEFDRRHSLRRGG